MPDQGRQQRRDHHLEPLGTHAIRDFPEDAQGLTHIGSILDARASLLQLCCQLGQQPYCMLAVVAGDGHELVQDGAALLKAAPRYRELTASISSLRVAMLTCLATLLFSDRAIRPAGPYARQVRWHQRPR